ncbi:MULTISPECIES: stage III sporulation protein AF [unclassified Paenibacillus]|uniref:stage III sporulation protein AF n=1 Tax=unclassified Paenibacillus TaxID=185978 RepID=UPI000839BF0B|nr:MULTISPECIES: stage III sporulation protein AF [unclassified Paenibacillus]NWL87407.1 stage III sporulation protein AF [Paenibacillus sp. 79R4]
MDFLGEWLKQIIIIVLFAVFIDLLLPNRAMERYVRFVVSLLILLTLIAPVVRIFTPEAKQKLEIALADNLNDSNSSNTQQSTLAILRQGEEMRQKQEAEVLQWTAEEAARQMKQSIEQETGHPVSRVTVKLVNETQDSRNSSEFPAQSKQLVYSLVEVVMASESEAAKGDEEGQSDKKITVPPVHQVEIDVDLKSSSSTDRSENPNLDDQTQAVMADKEGAVSETPEADLKKSGSGLEKQIEDLLGERWGVPRESVTVMTQ